MNVMLTVRAFRELHDGCRDRVRAGILGYVGNPSEADDVTAEAFATAFEKRKSFRGDASFYTWVYQIAVNEVRSGWRAKKIVSLDSLQGPIPQALIQPDLLDSILDRASCCRRLRKALRRIPVKYRRVLMDHKVRGYSVKQIAKAHGLPVGTVLSRIFTGKRLLRIAWGV
jgi:RNA polymerase sigma-70 factor (ECF subfamily)